MTQSEVPVRAFSLITELSTGEVQVALLRPLQSPEAWRTYDAGLTGEAGGALELRHRLGP